MTSHARPERSESFLGRLAARRSVRFVAFGTAAALAAGAIASAGGGAAGAATSLSNSTGRFLSGTIGGTNLDTVAGIQGESASYPSDPGPNQNSLNAELLNNAIQLPFKSGLQLPGLGFVQAGAVAQYAKANKDGSALGATGAIDSNGGIGVGGSNGVPKGGATIDLAGLPGASALTDAIGDLKLTVGAVTARAQQVAIGSLIADPSRNCTSGGYSRVSNDDQAGSYAFAGLTIDATSPLLASVGRTLTSTLSTLLDTLNTALKALPGGLVEITGFPTAAQLTSDLSVSIADGGITADLANGSLKVDLAKLLKSIGLDLNNLCPNTSLLGYVADALAKLPAALNTLLDGVLTKVGASLGAVTVTVAGVPLPAATLTNLIKTDVTIPLTTALGTLTDQVNTSGLQPLIKALTSNLLDIVVNAQSESGSRFTETAVVLEILPNGAPSTSSFVKPLANQAGANAGVALNLARATVGPNAAQSSTTPTPTPLTTAPPTALPTGVPAGQARPAGGTSALPVLLTLLALVFAGGGALAVRMRRRPAR